MAGGRGGIAALKGKVTGHAVTAMAWTSFALSIVGGAAATSTFVSDMVVGVFGWLGKWGEVAAAVALVVGVLLLVRDIAMDWEPNYTALIVAASIGTVARACSGGLSRWVTGHSQQALAWFDNTLGGWLPNGATGLVVMACAFAGAFVLAQRTVSKSHGGASGGR